MKTLTKKISVFFIVSLGVCSAWALRVTPTFQVFHLKPGDKITGQLTLTNNEDSDLLVNTSATDLFTLPENKKIKTREWLIVDETPFSLKMGESKQIFFTVKVPRGAKGELAGNLHFITKGKQVVSLSLSLATYVGIEGTGKPGMDIPALSVQISSHTQIGLLIVNNGNIHFRPRGFIQVYDGEDQLILNAEVFTGKPVFPKQSRVYTSTVKDYRLPEGKYRAEIRIEDADWGLQFPLEKKKFLINREGKAETK